MKTPPDIMLPLVGTPGYRPGVAYGDFDPPRVATALAGARFTDRSVLYECADGWWYAAGALCTVTVYGDRVQIATGDNLVDLPYAGSPLPVLAAVTDALPIAGWTAYGWLAFEFATAIERAAAPEHTVAQPLRGANRRPLAQLVVPLVEVRVSPSAVEARGVDERLRDQVLTFADRCANAWGDLAGPPAAATPTRAVDVRAGDAEAYRSAVRTAIDRIEAGRLAKVVLSRRVAVPFEVDLARTCLVGRRANTPARTFLLDLPGMRATGFSPEVVAVVGADRTVRTQPLAGTRAFGLGTDRDRANCDELRTDPKEIYEHAVSVQLSDAELRTVCTPGSVAVRDFMTVRPRGSVQHLGSQVEGRLDDARTRWDALAALFPAVTATGVPKDVACREITGLEPAARGLYAGAVLRLGADGTLDAALALRTVFSQEGRTWLRAGAGVVAGSRPEREYEETCEKLASVAPHLVPAVPAARPMDGAA
ncbi:salicylate synthase [Parafrankia sp. FMc6]|uniref:salicylate synthase n=1 Tax=Parafrankia soli TaxID=2599596 RepID=UPI0034D4AD49